MERRTFLTGATALGAVGGAVPAAGLAAGPLRAVPRRRDILPKRDADGVWLLHSDGPEAPPPTMRRAVIEQTFGMGTYDTLCLPDHWAMIEAGWFSGADLHHPSPADDEVYDLWRAFHHPLCEAHDLIADLLEIGCVAPVASREAIARGLVLAEHPCTPRLATARVRSDMHLCDLAAEVARRTDCLTIVLPEEVEWYLALTGTTIPDGAA